VQLSTQLPWYYIPFCLLFAAAGTRLLYKSHPFAGEQTHKRPWWVWVLTFFRFTTLFVLSFLLLEPLLKSYLRHIEKPIIIIASDASESILANKDSAYYRTQLTDAIKKLGNKLRENYQVDYFQFGQKVTDGIPSSFNEKQTNLSNLFNDLFNRYDKQNVGAVLLASDGIYNEGEYPLNQAQRLRAPIICVALGDTNPQRDIKISSVRHNQLAYLGNSFPLLIETEATHCTDEQSVLQVTKNGKKLFEKILHFTQPRAFGTEQLFLQADEKGMQHYKLSLSRIKNEISYSNNEYDVFIDVLDGKQKILLLAQCPHPDLGAILFCIESNSNYEVKLQYISENPNPDTKPYSLVIMHQLPGGNLSVQPLLDQLQSKRIPTLFVAGTQSNIQALNGCGTGYVITGFRGIHNDAEPETQSLFGLFVLDESLQKAVNKFPPLKSPFGSYTAKGSNEILIKQRLGGITTDMPLISFNKIGETKTGIIFGEGLWRWRLADYKQNNSPQTINELWSKMIQYLAAKEDKRNFRVHHSKKYFDENEHVTFEAELYNKSYELINEADVILELKNREGKTYSFTFSKTGKSYFLDAGLLPAGLYSYQATVLANGKNERTSGTFLVKPLVAELLNTRADHQLLANLADETKGKLFYPNQLDQLAEFIKSNETIKPVVYHQEEIMDLVNLKSIFTLILTLLSVEWFIRKRNGAY
jgi:hypothetical protein